MHDKLFANQQTSSAPTWRSTRRSSGSTWRSSSGAGHAEFKSASLGHGAGGQVGVDGTPAFFINGDALGRAALRAFKKIIDEELATRRSCVASGRRRPRSTTS
jgi:hypothetical protein